MILQLSIGDPEPIFYNVARGRIPQLFQKGGCAAPFLQFPVKYFYFHLQKGGELPSRKTNGEIVTDTFHEQV